MLDVFNIALLNLIRSPLRATLSLLGMTIGCASVAAVIQIGEITESRLLSLLENTGLNLIVVKPVNLFDHDIKQIRVRILEHLDQISQIDAAAFFFSHRLKGTVNGVEIDLIAYEVGENIQGVMPFEIYQGDIDSLSLLGAPVAIVPRTLTSRAKGVERVTVNKGDLLKLGSFEVYRVAGTLDGFEYNRLIQIEPNSSVFVPENSLSRFTRKIDDWKLIIKTSKDAPVENVSNQLTEIFEKKLGLAVRVEFARQLVQARQQQSDAISSLLLALGGVSLVVGAIGVANIMLVSVAERRREIGLRLAVGARRKDIMVMFLVECLTLCLIGGFLGSILGILTANVYAKVTTAELIISHHAIIVGIIVSSVSGMIAGLYPAYSSTRLDPVQALAGEQ